MSVPFRFRKECIACRRTGQVMNKEHFWPQWLITRTGTHKTGVRLDAKKRVNPRSLTIPMCQDCNSAFGRDLEVPMKEILSDLEAGHGLSDDEAEIIVRWMWKAEGLGWRLANPTGEYLSHMTLKDRVLRPIGSFRERVTLGIALIHEIDSHYGGEPMGLDSANVESADFVAGVFGRVAVMVSLRDFDASIPEEYSLYRFPETPGPDRASKLFFPKTGYPDCTKAIYETTIASHYLGYLHDMHTRGTHG